MPNDVGSPFSTGGGGYRFESRVGAYYLLSLLCGNITRGIDGVTKNVKFQQKFAGNLLDDIVVVTNNGELEKTLSLQVRYRIHVTENNAEFKQLIGECWNMFNGENNIQINIEHDRLGIIVSSLTQNVKDHLLPVLKIAKNTHDASIFLKNIFQGGHSKEKRCFVNMFRKILVDCSGDQISDKKLWQFLRMLNIMVFDIENDASSDMTKCLCDSTTLTKDGDHSKARILFDTLTNISSDLASLGGSVDLNSLRQKLPHLSLKEPINFTNDLRCMRMHANSILDSIHDKIGNNLAIPRSELVDKLEEEIRKNDAVFLRGEPFVGKSVLLKLLVARLRNDGEVLVFSVDRLNGVDLDNFLKTINVQNNFRGILVAVGSSPLRCILLDGLEKLPYNETKIRIFKELFLTVQQYNKDILDAGGHTNYCWKIVASCRSRELYDLWPIIDSVASSSHTSFFDVPNLTDDEIENISKMDDNLRGILKKSSLNDIIRKIGYLDMIATKIDPNQSQLLPPITESWLYQTFWHQCVRLSNGTRAGKGNADSRESIMKQIGLKTMAGENIKQSTIMDVESIDGLLSDRLISKEDNHLRFAHDVFEDYSMVTNLLHEGDNIGEFLVKNQSSMKMLRPFSIYVAKILEVEHSSTKWCGLLQILENPDLSPIWRHEALTAPIASTVTKNILSTINHELLESQGLLLAKLLKALRNVGVEPDPALSEAVKNSDYDATKILPYFTKPIEEKWVPILEFTLANIRLIDDECLFEFCQTAYKWMISGQDVALRTRIAKVMLDLFETRFTDEFRIRSTLGYRDHKKIRNVVIRTIMLSADCATSKIEEFLKKNALHEKEYHGFEDIMVEDRNYVSICKYLPKTAVEIFKKIYCEPLTPNTFGHYNLWSKGISHAGNYSLPTPEQGPFHILLKLHEGFGLELINHIVNHSTNAWKLEREYGFKKRMPLPQTLKLGTKIIQAYGDDTVFRWFRYPSLGNVTVISALMALENWMVLKIENGIDIKELFEKVLSETQSVAVIGVCTSIALKFSKTSQEAVLPILENPVFWHMDDRRFVEDLTSEETIISYANFLPSAKSDSQYYKRLLRLAKQTHRRSSLRCLVPTFFTSKLQNDMREKLDSFPEKNFFLFEDEKSNSSLVMERKRDCEIWAATGKIENYKKTVQDNQIILEFDMESQLTDEEKIEQEHSGKILRLYSFLSWSYNLLDKNKTGTGFTLDSALEFYEEISNEKFISKLNDHNKGILADAITLFAAALIIRHWDYLVKKKRQKWTKKVIKNALEGKVSEEYVGTVYPIGNTRSAARALPHLVLRLPKDRQLEQGIKSLSTSDVLEVRRYLFSYLRVLWNVNDKLILCCIDNVIKKWAGKNWEKSSSSEISHVQIMPVLQAFNNIPPLESNQTTKRMIKLFEKLLVFTINSYLAFQKDSRYNEWATDEWNWLFFTVFCEILLKHKDHRTEFLEIVFQEWEKAPAMMEGLLRSLLRVGSDPNLSNDLVEIWKIMFDRILESDYTKEFPYEGSADYRKNILGLLIFSDPTGIITWKKQEWKYLEKMIPHIHQWCERFGSRADCFPSLIGFLETVGVNLMPNYGISWLYNCIQSNMALIDQNNTLSLSELLWDSWEKFAVIISNDRKSLQKFVFLVDVLIEKGDPLAKDLKNRIPVS